MTHRTTHHTISPRVVLLAACLLTAPMAALAADNGGGVVMPPQSKPHGYTLDAMTSALAFFSTSGNDPAYYPSTPFQILYVKQWGDGEGTTCLSGQPGFKFTGSGDFPVVAGTPFFVPHWNADDSPPIIGTFPADKSGAAEYFFGSSGIGASGMQVIVDGKAATLGPRSVGGPVTTDPLPDGGGTHIMTLGAFITPLSVGTHTVRLVGEIGNTQAFADVYGTTLGLYCFKADLTYTVTVFPKLGK